MKILVCISHVPDTTSKISFVSDGSSLDKNGVQFVINPYDEFGLTKAMMLKEANGGKVTVITAGDITIEPVIRKALAIGADDAVRIDVEPKDAYSAAMQIASYAKENAYDLVLTGKETINYNGSQVGGMIAAGMDLPFISLASKLEVNGSTAKLETETIGGLEVVEVDLPAVISCAKGMAEQRIPNMRGIMTARSKPLEVIEATENNNLTESILFEKPALKAECKIISSDNVGELVNELHNVAKVI